MPNWCWTSYIAVGDKQEIHDLYKKMKSLEEGEKSLVENGFGKTWLGNLVTILDGDWNNISCRGEFFELQIDSDENSLRFEAMTAWGELSDLRRFICSKYPSLSIYYRAEEPGNCYYATNDADGEYFPERIKIDEWDNDPEYCVTWDEVFQVIAEKTGTAVHNMDDMHRVLETYNSGHEDGSIHVYEFTVE